VLVVAMHQAMTALASPEAAAAQQARILEAYQSGRFRPMKGSPECAYFYSHWEKYLKGKDFLLPCQGQLPSQHFVINGNGQVNIETGYPTYAVTGFPTVPPTVVLEGRLPEGIPVPETYTFPPSSESTVIDPPTPFTFDVMGHTIPPASSEFNISQPTAGGATKSAVLSETLAPSTVTTAGGTMAQSSYSTSQTDDTFLPTIATHPTYGVSAGSAKSGKESKQRPTSKVMSTSIDNSDESTGVTLTLYVALPPTYPNVGDALTEVVINYLNSTMDAYVFDRYLAEKSTIQYYIYYTQTISNLVRKWNTTWFWRHDISYDLYQSWGSMVVDDDWSRQEAKSTMLASLKKGVYSGTIEQRLGKAIHLDNVQVYMSLPGPKNYTSPYAGLNYTVWQTPTKTVGTYTERVDPFVWDRWRYFGLTLFCATMSTFCIVSVVVNYKQRRRYNKEIWMNLGSEHGVEKLLRTGWKIEGQSDLGMVDSNDKAKWGYREEDSMLIGGFEQNVPLGTEITLSHPSTRTLVDSST
jgi:hypothetical protein